MLAAIPMLLLMVAVEAAAHMPALVWLDSCKPAHLPMQLPVLAAGILCYAALVTLACRISIKRYEAVDL